MLYEHQDFRSYLKAVLAERIAANPSYSLRAFARDVKVNPSHLSAILKGKKRLSAESALRVARALGLDEEQAEYFGLLVQYEASPSSEVKDVLSSRLNAINRGGPVRDLSIDAFKAISDWYHLPILMMTDLSGFELTPKSAARRLGITPLEAEAALERLERLELIEKDEGGRYRKIHETVLVQTPDANRAMQAFHKQMMLKAAQSFDGQEASERYFASQVFAVDPATLAPVRAMIDKLADGAAAHFEKGRRRTEIYQLGVQLFRLTSKSSETRTKSPATKERK